MFKKIKKLINRRVNGLDNGFLDNSTLKVVFLASAVIIFAVLLTGIFSYVIARNAVVTKLKTRDLQYIAQSITDKIDGRLGRAKETSIVLANDSVIRKWIEGGEKDNGLENYALQKISDVKKLNDYDNSFVVSSVTNHYWTENGIIIDTMSKKDPDDSWFFSTIDSKERVSISIDFNKERKDTFAFINVLVGDVSHPLGVAGVGLNFKDISKQFQSYSFGENSNMWLVDKKGNIYISEDIEQAGKNITDYIPSDIEKQILVSINRDKLSNVLDYKNSQGVTYDLICVPLTMADWSLVLQIPRSESLSIVNVIKFNTLIVCIITTVLIILIFYFVTSRIANPYKHAIELTKKMEQLVDERTLELKEKNEKIMDSIEYARMIQMSVLPSEEELSRILKEHFLLWKPRDIVGGDFYYIKRFTTGSVVIVGDCTGHGVPGALMTMAVNSILNHIVNENSIKTPGKLLKEINILLKQTLYGRNRNTFVNDGLDAGVIYISNDGNAIFAGAKTNLYVKTGSCLNRVIGNSKSIGYRNIKDELNFEEHKIQLTEDSVFYITTDGYLHQNGGKKNLSFGRSKFESIIESCLNKSFTEQKNLFENELLSYMGNESQRDDILVLAFIP